MKIKLSSGIALKDKSIVNIYYSTNLFHCTATSLLLKSYAELIDNNLSIGNSISFGNDSQVIWAENVGKPVGGICFNVRKDLLQVWINFSFTENSWKGKGVNYECHMALEKYMRENNLSNIASHVSANNISRLKSCEKVGLKPTFYRMEKFI